MSLFSAAFGRNLARIRREQRYTKTELSRRMGVSRQSVDKWERGVIPDFHNIAGLVEALNVSLAELFGDAYEHRPKLTQDEHLMGIEERLSRIEQGLTRLVETMESSIGAGQRLPVRTRT